MLKIRSLNQLALHNLRQHRLRTALSIVAVALGAAMVVAVDVMRSAMEAGLSAESGGSVVSFLISLIGGMFVIVGAAILAVGGFLVFNAFAMSVTQRRQQMGALRALGMTRRQLMRLVLTEAVITGALGAALGLVGGPFLGQGIITLMLAVGGKLFIFGESSLSPAAMALAAVFGIGVTLVSAMLPAWNASRVSPLAALREIPAAGIDASPVRRTLLGVVVMVAVTAYLIVAPPGEWVLPPWDVALTGLFMLAWLMGLALILPGLVGAVGGRTRQPLSRRFGATGRLIADNLQRGRRRVMLTVLTFAVALMMIVALTGIITFFFKIVTVGTIQKAADAKMHILAPFDFDAGVAAMASLSLKDMNIPADVIEDTRATLANRATIMELYLTFAPELAPMFPGLFSYVIEPHALEQSGSGIFQFIEGDWKTAMPIMEAGCGVIIVPAVASANNVRVGDTFDVTGARGPVECTVAGIGSLPAGVSIISKAAEAQFDVSELPIYMMLMPRLEADYDQFVADLDALIARHSGVWTTTADFVMDFQLSAADSLVASMNVVLLLAILGAALGVVNTTFISVTERRLELGLFRAVGSTRRQVQAVVAGEAALIGLIGAALGLFAGIGLTAIFALVYGANSVGLVDLPLWPSAWESVKPGLVTGLVGLMVAPLIAAGAAWLPARSILRGAPVSILKPGL